MEDKMFTDKMIYWMMRQFREWFEGMSQGKLYFKGYKTRKLRQKDFFCSSNRTDRKGGRGQDMGCRQEGKPVTSAQNHSQRKKPDVDLEIKWRTHSSKRGGRDWRRDVNDIKITLMRVLRY